MLLVRHGQTPTTGKLLPGRAPGLHLADAGREQAQRAAERIAELPTVDAVYASPLERARETAAPIAAARGLKVQIDQGLLECDFGDWTGAELKTLMKLPEWGTVQRAPSTFRFPNGESFTEMQTRIGRRHRPAARRAPRRHRSSACPTPTRSRPPSPTRMGTHLDLFQRIVICTCSVIGHRLRHRRARRAHRQLHRRLARRAAPLLSAAADERVLRLRRGRRVHRRRRRPPGPRTFFLQARRGATRVTVKCEKQQAAAIAEYLRRVLNDLPDRPRTPCRRRWSWPRRSSRRSCSARSASATTAPPTGCWCSSRRSIELDEDGEPIDDDDDDRGQLRVYLTRGQALAFCEHADARRGRRPPAAAGAACPIDPDGHPARG